MTASQLSDRLVRGIDRTFLALAGIALVAMMVHISLDVVANLLLNYPVPLTNAIVTEYYMIAVAFLPLAAGEYRGAHIGVDLIVNRFPPAPRRWVDLMVLTICLAVYLMLATQAWQLALEKLAVNAFMMEQTTRVSTWPSYFIVPVGFILIALLLGLKLICRLLGRAEPAPPVETAEEELLERHGDV